MRVLNYEYKKFLDEYMENNCFISDNDLGSTHELFDILPEDYYYQAKDYLFSKYTSFEFKLNGNFQRIWLRDEMTFDEMLNQYYNLADDDKITQI